MTPRLVVHRDENIRLDLAEQPRRLLAVHGDLEGPLRERRVRGAQVEDGGDDVPLVCHLAELVDVDRVAREVDGVGAAVVRVDAELVRREDEAGALAAGQVLARRPRHLECLSSHRERHRLPGAQPAHARPRRQLPRAVHRRQHAPAVQQPPAQLVQVVRVVLVTQQDRIDGREVVQPEGGIVGVLQHGDAHVPLHAGGREEGVREQVDAVDVEDGRCGADVRDV